MARHAAATEWCRQSPLSRTLEWGGARTGSWATALTDVWVARRSAGVDPNGGLMNNSTPPPGGVRQNSRSGRNQRDICRRIENWQVQTVNFRI